MSNFIKTEIITKITGFDKNEDGTFQIQNITLHDTKGLIKNTIKIHKNLNETELNNLVGKTVKVLEVDEYRKGYKVFYAGKDIKLVKNENDTDIFEVKRELSLKVDNIVAVKDNNSKIQSIVKNGTRTDLFEIKLKGITINKIQDLKGKKVLLKDINIARMDGVGTFYSTEKLPVVI